MKIRTGTSISAGRSAFTRTESVIIVAVLGVLIALLLPAMSQSRRKARGIRCVSHLKNIALSFKIFANDHTGRFPMEVWPHASLPSFILGVMSNELSTPVILTCPADKRKPASGASLAGASSLSTVLTPEHHISPSFRTLRGQIRLMLVPPTGQVAGDASINRSVAANKKRI